MKKVLLTALSLFAISTASAGIAGTFMVEKYAGQDVGSSYTFASGEAWSSADAEEEDFWEAEIAATAEAGVYTVQNLIGWEEAVEGTYDEATGILKIKGGVPVYVDESNYVTYMCGGLDGCATAKDVMDYCDAGGGWIAESKGLKDVELKLEGDKLVAVTPILLYIDYYPGYGYHGSASSIYTELEFTQETGEPEATIAGAYDIVNALVYDAGDAYTFASGESWSISPESANEDRWTATIAGPDADGIFTIENLIAWDEVMEGKYDATTGVFTIEAGALIYVDDYGYQYYACGGLEGYSTAKGIMDYNDANGGWLTQSRALKNIELKIDGDKLINVTPILVYVDYYPGMGYHGMGYSVIAELDFTKGASGVNAIVNENSDAPVEYYNLQGIRLNNPANGQIVIKRQGSNVSKVIIR